MGNLKITFGAAVKSKRSELGMSQEELADRSGLHRTYISDVERGVRNASLGSVEKLARALELSVSALFGRTSEDPLPQLIEILLVEDNAQDVELTRRAFRKAKIANPIRVVRDGAEALDFLFATGSSAERRRAPLPGVILLDLKLPKIGGLEILRRLKSDQRTQKIPVVILTISDSDRDIAACQRLGVRAYIVKPVGFQNFSEVTPHLEMEWLLVKPPDGRTAGDDEEVD